MKKRIILGKIKKVILATVIFIVIAIFIVLGLKAFIERETKILLYNDIENIPPAETVIVLGASVFSDGKLSGILKDRTDTAYELFKQGKAKNFLVSGDHKTDDYNEVNAMANYLVEKGVPEEKIVLDHAGFDTYDSMYRSHAVFGIQDAIVVTQDFHLPRAIFIAKNLELPYKGLAAKSNIYQSTNSVKRRELFANFKALYEIILQNEPTTLKERL